MYNIYAADVSWTYEYESETKHQSTVLAFRNETYSHTKQFEVNCRLVFRNNWTCRNRTVIVTICLLEILNEISKRPRTIILHHDNASSQICTETTTINRPNTPINGHPPYNLDLSSNDFFSFAQIKNKLRGQRLSAPEEVVDAFMFWRCLNCSEKVKRKFWKIRYWLFVIRFKIYTSAVVTPRICWCLFSVWRTLWAFEKLKILDAQSDKFWILYSNYSQQFLTISYTEWHFKNETAPILGTSKYLR